MNEFCTYTAEWTACGGPKQALGHKVILDCGTLARVVLPTCSAFEAKDSRT